MSSEIKDLFSRGRNRLNEILNNETNSSNENSINKNKQIIKVDGNVKQIRCNSCKHISVFLNQDEITCCDVVYSKL